MSAHIPPIWLLDVDGVINATRPGWGAAPRKGEASAGGVGYTLRWAPALIDRIRGLHADRVVEVRWCTTWCAYADQLERLWHLPKLERAFNADLNGIGASLAKRAAARQIVADGHRLVWTDDVEVPDPGWGDVLLHDELTKDGRALLIRPSARRGLQPEHLDEIEAFAWGGVR